MGSIKVLVLGATGMAGHVITQYLIDKKYDVVSFSRKKTIFSNSVLGDVTDFPSIESLVSNGRFDYIINAVGVLNDFAEENKANAILINSYLPHFLVKITESTKTKIIHISTDCVFSGKDGNYVENSFKDGNSIYDKTKSLGEIINDKDLTFRTSIIGPDLSSNGIGLFNWFMKQENQVNGYSKAIWTGVTTLTLAKAIEATFYSNLTGLYHLVNNQKISKYELLLIFNKFFKEGKLQIVPDENVVVDKSLINTREDFDFLVPSYEQMIKEMAEWIEAKNIYNYY